jgi:hypothetical protein
MAAKVTKETSHDVQFAKGGNTHMFGAQKAGEQAPGETAHDAGAGSGDKFASGGKGKMFGFAGSQPARSGITSAR